MTETPSSETVSTKLQRIAELAREDAGAGLPDPRPPHRHRLAARGVPAHAQGRRRGRGRTDRRRSTRNGWRRTSGRCSTAPSPARTAHRPCAAPTSRRATGQQTRPIGIPTFEDKVLQRAVAMVLEAVYEQDFLDCSYGFRPGRSAHQALAALWQELMAMGGGWVLEVDIKSFFDTLGPSPPSRDSRPAGARRRAASDDRQVAERGRAGGRSAAATPTPARRKAE